MFYTPDRWGSLNLRLVEDVTYEILAGLDSEAVSQYSKSV